MEPNKDAQERIDAFMKGYEELTKKYEVDFANYPVYMPNQEGNFLTIIQSTPVDLKGRSVKSPFIATK